MKLIKLTDDHYVIVDENAEIKEGDWYLGLHNKVIRATDGKYYVANAVRLSGKPVYKITHSTDININELYYISLQEVKELLGEVDVEKKYNETWLAKYQPYDSKEGIAFKTGYNQAIEDNKEKKYTEEDMRKAIAVGYDWCHQKHIPTNWMIDNFIQSLQPKTEWNVEFDSQGKLKLI